MNAALIGFGVGMVFGFWLGHDRGVYDATEGDWKPTPPEGNDDDS